MKTTDGTISLENLFNTATVLAFSECSANTPNTTTINRSKTATFIKRKCSTAPLKRHTDLFGGNAVYTNCPCTDLCTC